MQLPTTCIDDADAAEAEGTGDGVCEGDGTGEATGDGVGTGEGRGEDTAEGTGEGNALSGAVGVGDAKATGPVDPLGYTATPDSCVLGAEGDADGPVPGACATGAAC